MITIDYNLFEEQFSSGEVRISSFINNNFYIDSDGYIKCEKSATTSVSNNIAGDLIYGTALPCPIQKTYLPSDLKFIGLNSNASRKKKGDPYSYKEGYVIPTLISKMFGGK